MFYERNLKCIQKLTYYSYGNKCRLAVCAEYRKALESHVKRDDWYMWAHMVKGSVTMPMFQSLDAYWPGLLVCLSLVLFGGVLA